MRPTVVADVTLTRRALTASLLTLCAQPRAPLLAAQPPTSCSLPSLVDAQNKLISAEEMLADRRRWREALSVLDGVDEAALLRALEGCVDPMTFTEKAMNNNAFIVYYEERRYSDLRLEPQTPSLRAEQNGRKKELMRALADEKAELAYLTKPGVEDDPSELKAYAATARKALGDFLALVPQPPAAAAPASR